MPLGSLSACDVDAHSGQGASLCALTGLCLQHVELPPPFYNGSRTCGKTGSVASSVLDYFHSKKQNLNSCEWLAWCHLCCEGRWGSMTLKHRASKEEFPAMWSTTQLNTAWDKSVFSERSRVIFFPMDSLVLLKLDLFVVQTAWITKKMETYFMIRLVFSIFGTDPLSWLLIPLFHPLPVHRYLWLINKYRS